MTHDGYSEIKIFEGRSSSELCTINKSISPQTIEINLRKRHTRTEFIGLLCQKIWELISQRPIRWPQSMLTPTITTLP
jgi:hypothetical protein